MIRPTIQTCVAGLAASVLVLAGCGGDDDDGAAGTVAPAATDPSPTVSDGEGPDATIDPDVPEDYVDVVRPVEVVGDALPAYPGDGVPDGAIGTPAPVLIGQGYDGATVRIDGATEGPTMVVFLAHWCSHCNAEVPRLNELRDAGRFPEDLNVVAVSTAFNAQQPNFPPGEWLTGMDWTYPAMGDGLDMGRQSYIAADAFGVNSFPYVALIDEDGVVVARWTGEREPDTTIELIETGLGL